MPLEVIVENVGSVYTGNHEWTARMVYNTYAGRYRPRGCAWYADVAMIDDYGMVDEYWDPARSDEDRD